jgi:hypothetical protein
MKVRTAPTATQPTATPAIPPGERCFETGFVCGVPARDCEGKGEALVVGLVEIVLGELLVEIVLGELLVEIVLGELLVELFGELLGGLPGELLGEAGLLMEVEVLVGSPVGSRVWGAISNVSDALIAAKERRLDRLFHLKKGVRGGHTCSWRPVRL